MIYDELSLPVLPRSGWILAWFVRGPEQAETAAARAALRQEMHGVIIAEVARCAGVHPDSVEIGRAATGRPTLAGLAGAYTCSFSHTHDGMGVAALGCGVRVGVDCEHVPPDFEWRPIAETYFTSEIGLLARCADATAARRAFFRFWTRKEAVAKATGRGVRDLAARLPLPAAAATLDPLTTWVESRNGPGTCWLTDFDLPGTTVGSVAWA